MSANFEETKTKLEKALIFSHHAKTREKEESWRLEQMLEDYPQSHAKKAPNKPVVPTLDFTLAWAYRDKKLLKALIDVRYVDFPKREIPRSKSWPSLKLK